MKAKTPKRAQKALDLLEHLVEQLHYFYGENDHRFRQDVLQSAFQIENILKDLAVNKVETHKRIALKYENYYKKKLASTSVDSVDESKLNDSIKERYRQDFKKDRT